MTFYFTTYRLHAFPKQTDSSDTLYLETQHVKNDQKITDQFTKELEIEKKRIKQKYSKMTKKITEKINEILSDDYNDD